MFRLGFMPMKPLGYHFATVVVIIILKMVQVIEQGVIDDLCLGEIKDYFFAGLYFVEAFFETEIVREDGSFHDFYMVASGLLQYLKSGSKECFQRCAMKEMQDQPT